MISMNSVPFKRGIEGVRRLIGGCMIGMMRKDDRVTYVDKAVHVVMIQGADKRVECVAAYMTSDKAMAEVKQLKADGAYAWCRMVNIEG